MMNLHTLYFQISELPLFHAFPKDLITEHIRNATFRCASYPEKSLLYIAGEPCHDVHFVLSGILTADHYGEDGQLISLAEFKEGDMLGGNATFSEKSVYPVTITTKTKAQVLSIEGSVLFGLISRYPEALKQFLRLMGANTTVLNSRILSSIGGRLHTRLLSYLYRQSDATVDRWIPFGMTKTRLAGILGVQRTSLSRALARMRSEGLIDFDQKSFRLREKSVKLFDKL